jgi:hypothetical protein
VRTKEGAVVTQGLEEQKGRGEVIKSRPQRAPNRGAQTEGGTLLLDQYLGEAPCAKYGE